MGLLPIYIRRWPIIVFFMGRIVGMELSIGDLVTAHLESRQ